MGKHDDYRRRKDKANTLLSSALESLKTLFAALVLVVPYAATAADIPTVGVKHLFNINGNADRSFSLPSDVAVDNRRVYVVDGGNHRVVVFDKQGEYLFVIGGEGEGDGQFKNPVGIGIDHRGRIYVADRGNRRVQIFDEAGAFVSKLPIKQGDISVVPIDVSVIPSGKEIFVTGNNTHSVVKVSDDGSVLGNWGMNGVGTGQFRYPASIEFLKEGKVAVVDVFNARVQVFSRNGEYSHDIGEWGVKPGQLFRPKGVAVDSNGLVYVSDSYMNVVQIFDSTGRFLYVLGENGAPKRMITASGLAVDENSKVYVAEMRNNRIAVYQIDSATGQ